MRFSARPRSSLISQLPVPLNSSKITSSMREPVSTSAVAMIVSEPPPERRGIERADPKNAFGFAIAVRVETAGQRAPRAALRRVVRARHARERVEHDHDVLAAFDQTMRALEHHLGDFDVALRRLVEARRDDLADAPRDGFAHFLGTLVDEQDEQRRVRDG